MNSRLKFLPQLLIGLLVAVCLLLLMEGVLRLLPVERWERDHPNISYPLFVPGEGVDSDWYVTNPHFKNSMTFNRIARVKPPGLKRIFILGGSAALGWPGKAETSFSGYMQRALDSLAPGRYEVVNIAAMSYGSHRVLDLLTDVVRMEPDLILVWSGNNEYIERNALSRFARSVEMGRLQRLLRHSMVYRTLRLSMQLAAPSLFARPTGGDITDPRSNALVRRGMLGRSPEIDQQVRNNYRENLREIARLIRDSGASGVLCTVPVNLSGWMPIDVPPDIPDPVRSKAWLALLREADILLEQQAYGAAAAKYEQVLVGAPSYARAHFMLGMCYQNLGRGVEALREFDSACDLDPRPVRANSAFQQIVKDVASAAGVPLLDLKQAFLDKSGPKLSGLDLFLDYVHPNDVGHRFAASMALRKILPVVDPAVPLAGIESLVQQDDWMVRNKFNQSDMYYTLGMTLFNNGDSPGAERAYLRALAENPGFADAAGNLAVVYDQRGDLPAARKYYEMTLRLDPDSIHAANLAGLLYRQGDRVTARTLGERVVKNGIIDARLFVLLGYIAFEEKRFSDALGLFRQAVAAGGENADVQVKIGDSLRNIGDEAAAREAYARAEALR